MIHDNQRLRKVRQLTSQRSQVRSVDWINTSQRCKEGIVVKMKLFCPEIARSFVLNFLH